MKKNILHISLAMFILVFSGDSYAQYDWSDYDYQLNFELDSKTGKYKPAYTYKSTAGNSTIWLDGANKKNANKNTSSKEDEQKYFLQFDLPKGWKVNKDVERAMATCADSTSFTIYKSRSFSGNDRKKDFITEWDKRLKSKFGEITATGITEGDYRGSGKFYFILKPYVNGGTSLIVIYDNNRAVPIVLDFPSTEAFKTNRSLMKSFLNSVKLLQGKADMSEKKI